MNATMQPMPMPRPGFVSDLIILSERARRERIITLPGAAYHEIPPAHVVDAASKRGLE